MSPSEKPVPILLLFVLIMTGLGVLWLAGSQRTAPARCPEGRIPLEHRCCWASQTLVDGACVGAVEPCRAPYQRTAGQCRLVPARILIEAGSVTLAPNDWQAESRVQERVLQVASFFIDRTEFRRETPPEPDLPLVNVSPTEAERHCHAHGGRLPTVDEWIFAAAGREGRRFAWGNTGLVCRRTVYGLVEGPCAVTSSTSNAGPDAVGSRPDGATPEGVLDLVGNVAEWARETASGHPTYVAMGGSFQSRLASELKVWSAEPLAGPRDDVGFRCVYPEPEKVRATHESPQHDPN